MGPLPARDVLSPAIISHRRPSSSAGARGAGAARDLVTPPQGGLMMPPPGDLMTPTQAAGRFSLDRSRRGDYHRAPCIIS
ncbi:MAG: hypothetical protein CMH68_10320 [Nisaea sp.]|nr:hypothetical protein [Nisaea sp.]